MGLLRIAHPTSLTGWKPSAASLTNTMPRRGGARFKRQAATELAMFQRRTMLGTVVNIGLSRKQVHEARKIRDAEDVNPGIVRRTLEEAA